MDTLLDIVFGAMLIIFFLGLYITILWILGLMTRSNANINNSSYSSFIYMGNNRYK